MSDDSINCVCHIRIVAVCVDVENLNVKILDMKGLTTGNTGIALLTLLAPIAWGTTYITVTEFLPDGRPLLVAAVRVVPAGIALLLAGRLISSWRPQGSEWSNLAKSSLVNFALFFPLLVVAVYRLPGGVAAATGGLQPILVGALSWTLGGGRPRRRDTAVAVTAAIGVAMIVVRPGAGIDPLGVVAAIAANISFALGVVLTKRLPTPPNRIAATGWQMVMAGAILVPLAVAVEGLPVSVSAMNLGAFAYLSLAGTALAFVLWFNGIRRLPVAGPPLLGLAAPITGAVLGWLVLNEALSALQIIGFALTIGSIAYGAALPTDRPATEKATHTTPRTAECAPQPA